MVLGRQGHLIGRVGAGGAGRDLSAQRELSKELELLQSRACVSQESCRKVFVHTIKQIT